MWFVIFICCHRARFVKHAFGLVWMSCALTSLLAPAVADDLAASQVESSPAAKQEQSPATLDYSRNIRPILSNHCFKCHGPDEKERKGGLRLDIRDEALKPAESGAMAIVPGKPSDSGLMARITATDAGERMPPSESNKHLSAPEIELLQRWIKEGADYKLHWSYIKPQRPALPEVKDRSWVRTSVDHFILQRLEQSGLKPAPEADRVTLLRRLTLDLVGLPPTLVDVDQFVNDASADAYEKVVDRLLASPHFGERLAQDWLDLSRYGDTNGYENDSDRSIWKYREWVINAFNRDMPFDRFTIEQIAGDLLPDATPDQKTATGFSRNVTYNEEGGADPDEYMVKYAVDRTSTTATVFLGMTMGCAECHDHKYDPVSQKDFYSLFAFFNSVEGEKGAQGHDLPLPPLLTFPTAEQAETLKAAQTQLAELDKRIRHELAQVKLEESSSVNASAGASQPRDFVWIDDALPTGSAPQGTEQEKSWQWTEAPTGPVYSGRLSHTRSAKGIGQHYFAGATSGLRIGEGDRLFAYVFLDPQNPPKMIMLQFNDGSWEHRAYWGENLVSWGADGTASRLSLGPLPTVGGWVRLEVEASVVGLAAGTVIHGMAFTQAEGKVSWDKAGLVTRTPQAPLPQESIAAWEKFELGPPNPPSKLPPPIREILQVATDKRSDAQKTELRNYFVRFVYSATRETFELLNKQYDEFKAQETKTNTAIPSTMVMAEMAQRRGAFVLMRGNYQTPGEQVTPNVPAVLPPLRAGQPVNRLGLARWLVDPDNPLTARVTVNRYWKQFFGTALVKTIEDFGSQGEFPSHPELLDWLAVEFMEPTASPSLQGERNGPWSVKSLVKLMVMSATYRQSSNPDGRLLENDPYNRLLSRAARFRLPAETIRDNALSISGLLNPQLGGRSVFPYQPADYYADKGRWKWVQSTGTDLYRRGLYTFWRRTTFYPSFQVFDAPTREYCTVDRPRTNTPLQALVTLNDPVFIEAARVFAQRVMQQGGESVDLKLTFAFRSCVARSPSGKELEALQRLYATYLAKYTSDSAAARMLVSNGAAPRPENLADAELAAWTAVGNVLLNLDETITRE